MAREEKLEEEREESVREVEHATIKPRVVAKNMEISKSAAGPQTLPPSQPKLVRIKASSIILQLYNPRLLILPTRLLSEPLLWPR